MRHARRRRVRIVVHEPYPDDMPMPEKERLIELSKAVNKIVRSTCQDCFFWYTVDNAHAPSCQCMNSVLRGQQTKGDTPACRDFDPDGLEEDDQDEDNQNEDNQNEGFHCYDCEYWHCADREFDAFGLCVHNATHTDEHVPREHNACQHFEEFLYTEPEQLPWWHR